MQLEVTMHEPANGEDAIRLHSLEPLCSTVEPGVDFASKSYYKSLERELTSLARAAVNHLCRGLQGITVRVTKDGTGCLVELIPHGSTASDLYMRLCGRVFGTGRELTLEVALERELGQPVQVDIRVHAGL
jgi:hypothetical protein